ncbi:uncharacterized protein LOC121641091 [Melanotaenia boesemani]|uniref:uncharacterized protein LOC121641091 n=1 Tax=Melanotaenia boesemani TaxID=1250792 RepID=UPI001C043B0B|nr:uncharacterized protein LOC121641091 [Melanotaenia boesemani]
MSRSGQPTVQHLLGRQSRNRDHMVGLSWVLELTGELLQYLQSLLVALLYQVEGLRDTTIREIRDRAAMLAELRPVQQFVVSGTLAVAAGRRTSVGLVWTSLMFNITSVLLGLAGLIYLCLLMATTPPSEMFCGFQTYNIDWMRRCVGKLWMLDRALYGLLGLLLVLLVLQVCVSVTVCVISGRVIKRHNRYTPIKVETDDDRTLLDPQHSSEHNLHAQSP